MCPIGAAIVDHRPKTHTKKHFRAVFDNAWAKYARLFASIRDHGWDLDPPLHARDEIIVKAVGSAWWNRAGKGEDRFICREGNGHCFLRYSRNHPFWLFAAGSENHREILRNTFKPFAQRTANRTSEIGVQKTFFFSNRLLLNCWEK